MTTTPKHDERMANMTFAAVYLHYVTKVEKKGRTEEIARMWTPMTCIRRVFRPLPGCRRAAGS